MPKADLVIVGGGPAGYVAALRAAQLGAGVVLLEGAEVGGTCLNRGCIPTKALLAVAHTVESLRQAGRLGVRVEGWSLDLPAVRRHRERAVRTLRGGVEKLLRDAGVRVVAGWGRLSGPGRVEVHAGPAPAAGGGRAPRAPEPADVLEARNVLLAPGSLPAAPQGLAAEGLWDSDAAQRLEKVPERLAVIGGGPVGVEFADLYAALGARVTLVEVLPRLLPREDADLGAALARALERRGVAVHVGTRVAGLEGDGGGGFRLKLEGDGAPPVVEADAVLVAVGRRPNVAALGLESVGLPAGWVAVDEAMRTAVPGLLAAGDVTGRHLLAHAASAQGIVAVEAAFGHRPRLRMDLVPACVFTRPEVASVGLSEEAARSQGRDVVVGRFPFSANGRAAAEGEREGFVKVVAEAGTGRLLGAHVLGPGASALVHEAALAIAAGLGLDDVEGVIHAHPTFSEALPEACLAAAGRPLHGPRER